MTHTLHRQGTTENLQDDYVVFAMSAKGINDVNSAEQMRKFFQIVSRHNPLNLGDMKTGNTYSQNLEQLETRVQDTSIVHAVYDNLDTVSDVLAELIQADLGLSVVVSGLLEPVRECCSKLGRSPAPHTVEYSLGIWGKKELLPDPAVLEISTMCGHGQVAFNLIKSSVQDIKRGRITSEQAARNLAEVCVCGVFNPLRAAKLLKLMAQK